MLIVVTGFQYFFLLEDDLQIKFNVNLTPTQHFVIIIVNLVFFIIIQILFFN